MKDKKAVSMGFYLVWILSFVVIIQCLVLISTLSVRNFYGRVDAQNVDLFYTKSNQQITKFNEQMSQIVREVVSSSREISAYYSLQTTIYEEKISTADLTNEIYQNTHIQTSKTLLNLLDECVIDQAFYIIFDEEIQNTIAVDIQNNYPELEGVGYNAYELMKGTIGVSKEYSLGINSKWEINISPDELEKNYFQMPLKAIEDAPYGDLEQYGYWQIPNENDEKLYYTLPLLDELGDVYGIIGISISQKYFKNNYMNEAEYLYTDSMYAIGKKSSDDKLTINNNLANSTDFSDINMKNVQLKEFDLSHENLYVAVFEDLELKYAIVKIDELMMYSNNSQFKDETLQYVTIISQDDLYKYSNEIKSIFFIGLLVMLIVGIIASIIIGNLSTRKIKALSKSIKEISSGDELYFEKTNFREIDEMTTAIKMMNDRVANASRTISHLFELTELNLGGFEIIKETNAVNITKYISTLLDITKTNKIYVGEWQNYYKKLTENIIDKDKNIYLYWLDENTKIYLRITKTVTNDSIIGTVLDVTKEIEDVMEAKFLLDYDALTKLYSRTAFYREAQRLIDEKPNEIGCVLFIDLDNLKYVNDTFGHDYGDLYLVTASKQFADLAQDIGVSARMSGDEFALYLHGFDDAEKVYEMILAKLETYKTASINLPDGSIQKVRFSSGVAWYTKDSNDIQELVKYADFAMYETKHTAKGSIRQFDRAVYDEKIYMMENREAINQLIEEKLVDFMFQPVVCLKTGDAIAFEALMRSKMDMFKSPLEILKVASLQFKLNELEYMVVCKAVETAYNLRDKIGKRKVFINSITSQIMPVELFEELREKFGDFLNQIVIEITEAEDNTPEKMRKKIAIIKDYGMDIAIDDFGSGYSNELRIVSINPDVVKIDMKLLQGISEDKDKEALCANIISYSHAKGIKIVAEGIEDIDDLQKVIELGADYVQGYYVAKPAFEVTETADDVKNELVKLYQEL